MANHVYFTIHVEGLEDEQFQENVTYETRTGKNYKDEEYTYRELLEIEEQPFMSNVFKEFEDGHLKDSYNWYCENVGAKWCNIDECEDSYISGYSAWRQPHELVLNLVEFFAKKYNTEVTASMTYEDEFRNFMGKQYYGSDKSEEGWYSYEGDYIETDGNELVEEFKERFPDLDVEAEDFDWYDEVKTGGDVIYPNEVLDEIADNFWGRC
ncbi:hypothetical protein N9I79_02070 [Gammaproteobacteria bacterium]|nr:hypothetical protein [Gammaproteobacteria bacterium]